MTRALPVLLIIMAATGVRGGLIVQGWPELNSDEATIGLMAIHILKHGARPIFEYGQPYMGATEAYLAAFFFQFMGPTTFALRLGNVLLFDLFLASLYLLARQLYSHRVGLVTILILSLGPEELLFRQVESIGGVQETLFLGAAAMLLATRLAMSPACRRVSRTLAWSALGLTGALAFWSDPLFLPFALAFSILIVRFSRGEIAGGAWRWLALGALVGSAPFVAYNLAAPLNRGTLAGLVARYAGTGSAAGQVATTPGQGVAGTLLVSLPMVTGARPVCALPPQEAWPLSAGDDPHVIVCSAVHAGWSAAVIALWLLAALGAVSELRQLRVRRAAGSDESRGSIPDGARQFARLMLLAGAGLTLVVYALSSAPALEPRDTARYLSFIWFAVPALAAPLVSYRAPSPAGRVTLGRLCKLTALAFLFVLLGLGTVDAYHAVPWTQWRNAQEERLVDGLLAMGAVHIYSDYWTCDRVAFESRERISCAVLLPNLRPGWDRYLPYKRVVRHDPNAAYFFRTQSPQAGAMARRVARSGRRYQRRVLDGYVLFRPAPRLAGIEPTEPTSSQSARAGGPAADGGR